MFRDTYAIFLIIALSWSKIFFFKFINEILAVSVSMDVSESILLLN